MSDEVELHQNEERPDLQVQQPETEPLEVKICDPSETTPESQDDVTINPAAAALIEKHEDPEGGRGNCGTITSYSIDACFQNTTENPYRETTVTVPYLLRKVPSEDLVPQGWKNINRIIIASYLSMFCCIITGVIANQYAWDAKTDRARGLYTLVQKQTKTAVRLIYLSVAVGLVLIVVIPVAVVCGVYGC